jgi:hypothetical protein
MTNHVIWLNYVIHFKYFLLSLRRQLRCQAEGKNGLFCNYAFGETFLSTTIAIIKRLKFAEVKAKVFQHLEAWVQRTKGGFYSPRSRYSSENKRC